MRADQRWAFTVMALLLAAGVTGARAQQPEVARGVERVRAGAVFPSAVMQQLNGPETRELSELDLASVLGKKSVALLYWIPGNPRADAMLSQTQSLVEQMDGGKLDLFVLVFPQPGRGTDVILGRAAELGVRVPILVDEGFRVGQRLGVRSVPFLALIDAEGRLRLANAATLTQVLEYKMTVETAVRRLGAGEGLITYGYLDPYYPVNELVGLESPDFAAPALGSDEPRSWRSMIAGDRVNVLIFWSVDCPHCRSSLPEINAWLKEHPEGVQVVAVASIADSKERSKTQSFTEEQGFVFTTLEDRDGEVARRFQVTSTPTILIVGPDAKVDSVMLSSFADFGRILESKKRTLLAAKG